MSEENKFNQLQHLKMLAETDFDGACNWAEYNIKEVRDFFETWARHCGAPKSVFVGHTIKMLISLSAELNNRGNIMKDEAHEDESANAVMCEWGTDLTYYGEDSTHSTQCGEAFYINEGTPEENGIKFCCFCGKPVKGN